MEFFSTRDASLRARFREAVFRGLAPDGGLYQPLRTPDLGALFAGFGPELPLSVMAEKIVAAYFAPEIDAAGAARIARKAFYFEPALVDLEAGLKILELFHGPSCAFKDFGASFLAAVMEEFLSRESAHAVILTATSGDTGSAVAQAFHGRAAIDVVILYPSGRVSPLQEKQLTTVGGNVIALEVKRSFDDCQRMVKEAFVDPDLTSRIRLTSANSINLGRLIPQAFYYIWAYTRLSAAERENLVFCVPSGNFGNLTAGVMAWQWGLPVKRFLAATNINKVVPEYLESGVYTPRPSVLTLSNAMDVGNPSNFERLKSIFGPDADSMREMIEGVFLTDEETMESIRGAYSAKGMFLDPHSALGVEASRRFLASKEGTGRTVVSLATAHPGKFLEVVEEAVGARPPLPPRLAQALSLPKKSVVTENTGAALKAFLLDTFA